MSQERAAAVLTGEVLVEMGDQVVPPRRSSPDTELPGNVQLGEGREQARTCDPTDLPRVMLKREGDDVEKGETDRPQTRASSASSSRWPARRRRHRREHLGGHRTGGRCASRRFPCRSMPTSTGKVVEVIPERGRRGRDPGHLHPGHLRHRRRAPGRDQGRT